MFNIVLHVLAHSFSVWLRLPLAFAKCTDLILLILLYNLWLWHELHQFYLHRVHTYSWSFYNTNFGYYIVSLVNMSVHTAKQTWKCIKRCFSDHSIGRIENMHIAYCTSNTIWSNTPKSQRPKRKRNRSCKQTYECTKCFFFCFSFFLSKSHKVIKFRHLFIPFSAPEARGDGPNRKKEKNGMMKNIVSDLVCFIVSWEKFCYLFITFGNTHTWKGKRKTNVGH